MKLCTNCRWNRRKASCSRAETSVATEHAGMMTLAHQPGGVVSGVMPALPAAARPAGQTGLRVPSIYFQSCPLEWPARDEAPP
jgi:hypothetical protein